jgi:hypothetical protein
MNFLPTVQMLVKCTTIKKHVRHVGHVAHIQVVQMLVEFNTVLKHARHVGDATYVPVVDVSVFSVFTRRHVDLLNRFFQFISIDSAVGT